MILDKKSESVLKLINKHKSFFSIEDIHKKLPKYHFEDIENSVFFLLKNELLTYADIADVNIFVVPTFKGQTYFEIKRKENFNAMLNSTVYPIIVSIITTVIVLILRKALGLSL
jgi:hypothetical protein